MKNTGKSKNKPLKGHKILKLGNFFRLLLHFLDFFRSFSDHIIFILLLSRELVLQLIEVVGSVALAWLTVVEQVKDVAISEGLLVARVAHQLAKGVK